LSGVILLLKTPGRDEVYTPLSDGAGNRPGAFSSPSGANCTGKPQKKPKLLRSLLISPLAPLWGSALTLTLIDQLVANLTGRLVAERIASILPPSLGVTGLTGLLLGFRSFGALILSPLAGLAGDRFGRVSLLSVVVILQAGFIAGIAFFRTWPLLVVCLLLQFAAGIVIYLLISTIAGDLAPESTRALHMSRFSTFHDLGTSLGPVLGFAIYSRCGIVWVAVLAWVLIFSSSILVRRLHAFDRQTLY
jgi:MFS family permease